MASSASVVPSINTSSNNQKDGSHRSVKQTPNPRMTQKGRKESPSDANRHSTSSKAWSGPNPVTQRASTPNQSKGNSTLQSKNSPAMKVNSAKDGLSDKHSYDRLKFVLGGSIGLQVVLITKAGDKYEGVLAGFSAPSASSKFTLKMTKKVVNNPITQPNGISSWEAAFTGSSPDYAMTFDLKDMADLTIPEFSLPETSRQTNGTSTQFQTDADISGNANRGERVLQRWQPDPGDTSTFSLDAGSATGWDQFATHARMTGGQSSYNEETYTTAIDRNAPDYKIREAKAARLAREIETAPSANAHVREERGQAVENDFGDEEDKYSGVRRDQETFAPLPVGNATRYTPPALRAPSGQPGATGVPIDPAIISSQIARADGSRSGTVQHSTQSRTESSAADKATSQARAASLTQPKKEESTTPSAAAGTSTTSTTERPTELIQAVANGSASKLPLPTQIASTSPERSQQDSEPPSQGVENKVLGAYRQFAQVERARLAEKKRQQASQDRTAKINDLLRFAKTFKLKTPIPEDLVGILAKDPKKQEAIMEKAQRDHQEAKVPTPPAQASAVPTAHSPPVTKFDRSQIPPPIPERNTFAGGRAGYAKPSVGRGTRPLGQPVPFPGSNVPVAPRGQALKNGPTPTPIPLPDIKSHQSTAGNSGVSSPRGTDTPTSAVSTKFNVRALEFRPTAPSFNPSSASVSAASPSPVKRTASVARVASPSSFFGQRKPRDLGQRLDITKSFNSIQCMQKEVKAKLADKSAEDKRDFASNGGIPNAYHTNPVWLVPESNRDKSYQDFFVQRPPTASPAQSRSGSHHTIPFHGQMQMPGGPQSSQAVTPQHGHHAGPHFQPHFDDQRMHMQSGSPSMFASPNMTPRNAYVSPMGHPAQATYGHQSYFGNMNGPMPMRPYGNNVAMMHGQHGHMTAPMMVQQQSSGPYLGMQNQMGMVFPSPRAAHVFPHQQNGYPSPGQMAPMMISQNSQQGYHGTPGMMYANPSHTGAMYSQPQMGRGYGGNTPYGSSPHQPHSMNQRAMSSGYGQKNIPQIPSNMGAPANAPQQPAAFGQMPPSDEGK